MLSQGAKGLNHLTILIPLFFLLEGNTMNLSIYDLSRAWWNFAFENPELVRPIHTAIYFFAIEHCNRLGWKDKFGFPTTMAMEAIGAKSYNTYTKALNEIVGFGFIKLIEKSKNQYSSNVIALSNFDKADNKALDKALIKHSTKQSESTIQSIDSIIIQDNNNTNSQESSAPPKIENQNEAKIENFNYDFEQVKRFYNEQYKANIDKEKIGYYEEFVKFLLNTDKQPNAINEPLKVILSIQNQVSYNQFVKIRNKAGELSNIKQICIDIENYCRSQMKKPPAIYIGEYIFKWIK